MAKTHLTENLERLRQAWDNAPEGVKSRVFNVFGYSQQIVSHIMKYGRKDDDIVISLLNAVKQASKDVLADAKKKNELVQAI